MILIGLVAWLLGALSLKAETEVIFSRVGPDAVEIETSGEKRVFSPSKPAIVEVSRQSSPEELESKPYEKKEAPVKKNKKRDPSIEMEPSLSEGKVHGKVTSPSSKIMGNVHASEELPYESSEGKILETAPLLNEDQLRYNQMEPAPAPAKKVSRAARPAADHEEMESLRAELAATQQKLAQMQRLIQQPLILKFRNDILDLQWSEAKQRIALPEDGIVRLQLAPKE